MNTCMNAIVITASLVTLQTLATVRSTYAQEAQDLQPLEEIQLTESANGTLEIPSIGGPSHNNPDIATTTDVRSETVPATEISFPVVVSQQTDTCPNSEFIFFLVCWDI